MGNVAAMKNKTLLHPEARAEILRRIEALTPRSERRWGRMTPHQMACHLSDACRAALGERRVGHWYALGAHRDQVACNTHERHMAARRQDRAGGRPGIEGLVQPSLRATSMNCESDSAVWWRGSAALRRPSVIWRPVGGGMGQIQLPSCGSSSSSIRCMNGGLPQSASLGTSGASCPRSTECWM